MEEHAYHPLSELFAQLGLNNDKDQIIAFVKSHRPLASSIALENAPWWSVMQAAFIKEAYAADGDWTLAVDELNRLLR